MTLLVLICHVLVDCLFGLSILKWNGVKSIGLFEIAAGIAIGIFADTMLIAILNYFGVSISTGFGIFGVLSVILYFYHAKILHTSSNWRFPLLKGRLKIGEMILLGFLIEKIIWSLINLIKLPIYFDDALNHWSGRGKALLAGVNWSWDPESIYFLGRVFGHEEYPLMLGIWRATNTAFIGSANGASERVDSFIMWMIIMIVVTGWVFQKTGKRWLGLTAAYIIAAIPLETWHMTGGYAEIFIQGFLILSFWALLNDKYVLSGLFGAALIWSKNEGLILFIPCVIACLGIHLLLDYKKTIKEKLTSIIKYNLSWMITISPWLIFKLTTGVGLTIPGDKKIGYVDGTLSKLSAALFDSPSSSILWIFLIVAIVVGILRIIKDKDILTLTIGALILLLMMIFVFTSTGAYIFLENGMTIQRSFLQIAPIFIIVAVLSLGQYKNDHQLSLNSTSQVR